jgi:hypothetical protein
VSLLISLPCAVVAAVAYGASTAVEHSAARSSAEPDGGGLGALVRNPRGLLGLAGDTLGLLFQVAALATGPVVLIQPILVLALPVSLPIAWWLGGPRPGRREYLGCGWIVGGLAVFFALVGNPGDASTLATGHAITAAVVVTVAGLVLLAAATRGVSTVRAAVFGGVAGAWFGFVAVLMDAVAVAFDRHGVDAFTRVDGLVPLVVLLVLGGASIALTQVAFQAGSLGASFPANLAADPVLAVILGAALLHETIPLSAAHVLAYLVCIAAVVWGAVRLATGSQLEEAAP